MVTCTAFDCETEVDSEVIDPDMPQAAFCSQECIEETIDEIPDYVAPVIFPEAE